MTLRLADTRVATPTLVPEIRLHLLTPDSPHWHASDPQALGWPYWAVAWPGGQALARYVLDHPEVVRGRRVLDFGSGGAVEGIAAMKAGALSVLCADVDPLAAEAARANAALNGVLVVPRLASLGDDSPSEHDAGDGRAEADAPAAVDGRAEAVAPAAVDASVSEASAVHAAEGNADAAALALSGRRRPELADTPLPEARRLDAANGVRLDGVAQGRRADAATGSTLERADAAAGTRGDATSPGRLGTTAADLVGSPRGPWDVVLAGDVCFEPAFAARVIAWLRALATDGCDVLLGDPSRVALPEDALEDLARYEAPHDGDVRALTRWTTRVARVLPAPP